MTHIYLTEFRLVARRALALWNREPSSPSRGCFDRSHWGWKKADFPDATLQYGVKLAAEYAVRSGRTTSLSNWLVEYVRFCSAIQRSDGSFDQCYPYERAPGVFYDILSTLLYVRESPYLDTSSRSELEGVLVRGLDFCEKNDETHGEIANHLAEYAFELLNASVALNRDSARHAGMRYLERTLALYHPAEGWFDEYCGPDPGYQTRTLRYLFKCAEILEESGLWEVVRGAARFVEDLLMPDGSLHPMLGVRSTAVLYPAAFEKLARREEAFRPLAARIRAGWETAACPLPSWLDFENAMRLADDALEAHDAQLDHLRLIPPEPVRRWLPEAGLLIWRQPQRTVAVAARLGGATVIYHENRLAAEDAGFLTRTDGPWVTRMTDAASSVEVSEDRIRLRAGFFRSLHEELDPARLILLRLLNLTVLRWGWLAEVFKKIVVRRLMTGRRRLAIDLEREVALEVSGVVISDRIEDKRARKPKMRKLWRCRRLVGVHMASSRYFQEQELELGSWLEEVAWAVDSLELRREVSNP